MILAIRNKNEKRKSFVHLCQLASQSLRLNNEKRVDNPPVVFQVYNNNIPIPVCFHLIKQITIDLVDFLHSSSQVIRLEGVRY